MADFKPILLVFLSVFVVVAFLNLTIGNSVDLTTPNIGSAFTGISHFMTNGVEFYLDLVVITIDTTINPVTWIWFGIDFITDFVNEQIIILSYLPNAVSVPLFILIIISLIFIVVSMFRGN